MNAARILSGIRQRLLTAAFRSAPQDIHILMLHEVTADTPSQHPNISITRENLEKLLDSAQAKGISFVPVSAIHEPADCRRGVLTFDDIFANACDNAFPLLRQRGIPYTVFITTEYVDKPGFVTAEQLEVLKQDPLCTIGFHADTHVLMRELDNAQIRENTDSAGFEEAYGVKCRYFAFPYGSVYACPRRAVAIVAQKGYKAVFSTVDSGVSVKYIQRNPWFVPRICVNDRSWENVFE